MRYLFLLICTTLMACSGQADSKITASDHDHRQEAGNVEGTSQVLTKIEAFHGHIGPYVVLGYKMALMARDLLDSPGYFDLTASVETPLSPPPSCLIDGIQLGSGCTTGKRNLTVAEGPIGKATFQTKEGNSVVLSLRADVPEKLRRWIDDIGVEESGRRILKTPTTELIEQLD